MSKGKPVEFRLKVPWGHVAAKAWGDRNDGHVLMVHGNRDNIGSFERLLPLLPHNFYYVAIDLPGHGLSSHMAAGTLSNFYDYVLAIRYVLDELQWETTYYIGHSFGALLGSFFAHLYPERIKKLVQLDALVPLFYENDEIIEKLRLEQQVVIQANKMKNPPVYTKEEIIYAFKNLRLSTLRTEAAEALFERSVTKVGDNAYIYNRDLRTRIPMHPLHNYELCMYFLKKWKVETLIIFVDGTLPFIRELRNQLCRVLDNLSYVHMVEIRGNHDVHNNYPERVAEYICKFLNNIPSKL